MNQDRLTDEDSGLLEPCEELLLRTGPDPHVAQPREHRQREHEIHPRPGRRARNRRCTPWSAPGHHRQVRTAGTALTHPGDPGIHPGSDRDGTGDRVTDKLSFQRDLWYLDDRGPACRARGRCRRRPGDARSSADPRVQPATPAIDVPRPGGRQHRPSGPGRPSAPQDGEDGETTLAQARRAAAEYQAARTGSSGSGNGSTSC